MKTKARFYIELAARYHVFIFLNIYGWGKILGGQFYRKGHLPENIASKTLNDVKSFDLAWTFFGHSYPYILFIGISQIIGAWLLLWNKTKLLGAAILIPILLNIVIVDIFFLDTFGALASACNYLFLTLLILYLNKARVIETLKALMNATSINYTFIEKLTNTVVALLIVAVIFTIEQVFVNLLGH